MNPVRVKAYCDRCGSRWLYNACRFSDGQVFKRFMCAECGRWRTVAQVIQARWRRQALFLRAGRRFSVWNWIPAPSGTNDNHPTREFPVPAL